MNTPVIITSTCIKRKRLLFFENVNSTLYETLKCNKTITYVDEADHTDSYLTIGN